MTATKVQWLPLNEQQGQANGLSAVSKVSLSPFCFLFHHKTPPLLSVYNTGVSPTTPLPEACFYNISYQIQPCKVAEEYLDILFLLTVQLLFYSSPPSIYFVSFTSCLMSNILGMSLADTQLHLISSEDINTSTEWWVLFMIVNLETAW